MQTDEFFACIAHYSVSDLTNQLYFINTSKCILLHLSVSLQKLFSLSQESGRSAAKFIINNNPKLFTKDFAEPHIPCLMPETVSLRLEEVSEEALKERITLRKVTAAVDMYDQLLQAGTTVSMETTHSLLDLICLYSDRDPVQDGEPQTDDAEFGEELKKRKARVRRASDFLKFTWKENNNAERIFNLLPERDTRCYSALIRGMVKHGAYAKAFSMYTDMLNNRLTADVHIFSALISAAPDVRDKFNERWDLIELLNQMNQQKVRPNLLTFNSVLKSLRRCGFLAKTQALHTLNEMKALGIGNAAIRVFYYLRDLFLRACFLSLQCLDSKDLELGYKIQSLVDVGENWRLLGDSFQQSIYYGRFFNLLCMMEHIDVVLKWYKQIIPSLYYPNPQGMRDLLQALDTDSRLDLLPSIWKDIKTLGHDNKPDLVEELLGLMAREKHSPEVQESFAACALDVKSVFDLRPSIEWSAASLSHITTLLLRFPVTLFPAVLLYSEGLLNNFLSVCHSDGDPQKAVELVQLSAAFCLPTTWRLAKRALAEFDLTEEQR
uniref:Small ribosomal subunit protein mS39 n=1 Tax=Oreochromis niloticus TaxID=8128 RepID=A0A669CI15_ORENI